jgi:hypothetical protein
MPDCHASYELAMPARPKIIKPSRITAENRRISLILQQYIENCELMLNNISENSHLQEAISKGYIEVKEGRVALLPVTPRFEYLEHRGFWDFKTRMVMGQYRIIGNPSWLMPTYLCSHDWHGVAYGWLFPEFDHSLVKTFAKISTKKLLETRNVFVDPESLDDSFAKTDFEKSFFVLGGVPKEAITEMYLANTGWRVKFLSSSPFI